MNTKEIKSDLLEMVPEFAKKVQPLYQQLHWHWNRGSEEPFIPQVEDIEETLRDLIAGLDEDFASECTGGLCVYHRGPNEFDSCGEHGMYFHFGMCMIWGQGGKTRSERSVE